MLDDRPAAPGPTTSGDEMLLAEVSNRVVQLHDHQLGRGPTKAKTSWVDPDTLLCTLEDSLSAAERSIVARGAHQRLREARLVMDYAIQDALRELVEHLVGRQVRAFISGIDPSADVSVQVYFFDPTLA